jgi:hypothetical protein
MAVYGLLAKAATTVFTGLVGVTAYEVVRKAEEAAESARLKISDVVAEARERIGEEAPTPAVGDVHDHEH